MAFTINFRNIRALFGKTKVRSQMGLMATEDGRLLIVEIPVKRGCAVDDEKISAFLSDAQNLVKDETTGISYQLLGERSCVPICPIKPREEFKRKHATTDKTKAADIGLWELMKGVFHDSWVADLIMINRKGAAMKREQLIYLILASTVPLAALLIAIKMIRG
jgi:hypothetical protein